MSILPVKLLRNKKIQVQNHVTFAEVPGSLQSRLWTGVFQTLKWWLQEY